MAYYYKNYGKGYAGPRGNWKPKGVVIHNTAVAEDSALDYFNSVIPNRIASGTMGSGYAHYYIDSKNVVQVADTRDGAWHTANYDGNMNYVGYEVCDSVGEGKVNIDEFLANEQATFKQVAEDLEFWGLKPTRSTVRLHREFYNTACPHRSWELHGKSVNKVKDYFIKGIKSYMVKGEKKVTASYYKTSRLKAVKITKECWLCKDYKLKKRYKKLKVGDVLKGVEVYKPSGWNRVTRLKYKGYYLTGNTDFVTSTHWLGYDYTKNRQVRILKECDYCTDKDLKKVKGKVKKGEIYTIVDNVVGTNGYTRLKTKSGYYITAHKSFTEWI